MRSQNIRQNTFTEFSQLYIFNPILTYRYGSSLMPSLIPLIPISRTIRENITVSMTLPIVCGNGFLVYSNTF